FLSFNISRHCIPNKFRTASPCKVANIICFEDPGLLFISIIFFSSFCFFKSYYFHHIFCCLCFLPTSHLCRCQYLCIVLTFACGTNNMISRHCHLHFKVSKCQSKLSTTSELVILPTLEITIHAKTWIPLCHCKKIVTIFRKQFITTTTAFGQSICYVIIPINGENKFLSCFQYSWKFNSHHCFIDRVLQWFASCINDLHNVKTIIVR